MTFVKAEPGRVLVSVKAVAGAKREGLAGVLGEGPHAMLKVKVTAPAEGGRANASIRALLADRLGIPEASVTLIRGHTNPIKTLSITGLSAEEARRRLAP